MNTRNIILISTLLLLIFQSCYKEPDLTNFDYKTYNRVIGPDGGKVDFYGNYSNDNSNTVMVSLNVPQGALDSMMVFNMYQFEDYELVLQMENGYAEIGSKFLYFVPFYESDGYHERGQLDLSYHLSLDFNSPVSVTYNFLAGGGGIEDKTWQDAELYFDHYKKTNRSYRLYRIKIPKLDEWGEGNNIYVNWNRQGYPDGYDRTDLYYIISGIWSPLSNWGEGYLSLENWEPVHDFNLDAGSNSVSFEVANTDYIYVVCRIIYISAENVPTKIANSVQKLFPSLEIERASFKDDKFVVFLSDNSYATYSKNGNFQYLTKTNLSKSDLPVAAQNYINTTYSDDLIKKITQVQAAWWDPHQYEVLMRSGLKLFFDDVGNFSGLFQYGIETSGLPASALTYLQQSHPGELITNVTYDNEDLLAPKYIVYLSSDAKVYFDGDGSWIETLFYRIDSNQLPDAIEEYFATNYPNAAYSQISYTLSPGSASRYNIITVDSKYFSFDDAGELIDVELESIEESDLPDAISTFINTNFPNKEITQVSYYSHDKGSDERYKVYFADMLNIEFTPSGEVTALYGNNSSHLPLLVRTYIATNYPNEDLLYCNFDRDGYSRTLGSNEIVEHKWDLFLEGNLWVGLDESLNFVYFVKRGVQINSLIAPITNYLNANYPGETTVYEVDKYFSPTYSKTIFYVILDDRITQLVFNEAGVFIAQLKKANTNPVNKSVRKKTVISKKNELLKKLEKTTNDFKK